MASWAKVGAKVVCVDQKPMPGWVLMHPPPKKGEVLTITGIQEDRLGRGVTLTIGGYPNHSVLDGHDLGWHIRRFRPVKTQEQDVAMFKSLLESAPLHA